MATGPAEAPRIDTPFASQPTVDSGPYVSAVPAVAPYQFSTEEYLRSLDEEFFPREARLELWDGVIYTKMAKTRAHETSGDMFGRTLWPVLPPGWFLSYERTLKLGGSRAPLPDLMIVRGRPEEYAGRRAVPADIGLLVELSVTSLKEDSGPKLREYARDGVPHSWIANLIDGTIQAHRDPVPDEGRYATCEVVGRDGSIGLTLDGMPVGPIPVADLMSTS